MTERDRAADGGPRVPQDLVDVTAAAECVLFAGAGIGAAAGFPYWRDVLRGVLTSLTAEDERAWRDLARQVEAGETQLVAELMRSRLEPASLQRLVAATYHQRREPTHAEQELLKRLDQLPWSGIVTDVWGGALELFRDSDIVEVSPADELDAAQLLAPGTQFLLKAYGDIEQPSTFLFSFEDYRRAVSANRSYELFLGTLFARRTLLFLGTSMEGVEQFCIGSGLWERSDRSHYAVVPDNPAFDLQRERIDARFGVKLLAADPALMAEATSGFVARLHRGVARRLRPTRPRTAAPAERISHVHLENIGPFEQLSLDVGRSTTVLLGDNGSGKTTVLRAIALALCGSAAETVVAPSRLLRADASAGQIVLETSNGTYRTILRRERSVVRADARGVTSVEAGVLLALGIPSLRGTTAAAEASLRAPTARAPAAADLLPLVQDTVDPRLADLKTWIIRNQLLARDPREPSAGRRARLLEDFFDTIRALTPGVDFTFDGVDADSGDVLLRTPDGVIPLDLISQGMSSMLACIGLLLQRLSERNDDGPASSDGPALMLVDELDAHLHPLWQWKILPLLRERFPQLELIATTHSPLVVANSRAGELIHIHREPHGLVADHLERPFAGWRADQILTHPLFGLATTMDAETATELERYRQLLAVRDRTPAQERQVRALAGHLGERLPEPDETAEARKAAELLQEFLDRRFDEQLAALDPDTRRRIAEEAQLELTRMYGGA